MKHRLQVVCGAVFAIGCLLFLAGSSPALAGSDPSSCGVVLELPEGSEVRTDPAADRLLVRVPHGYVLRHDGEVPRFVAADWDTAVPYSEELEAAVDCDCDGQGRCREVTDGKLIWCDAIAPCTDCKMSVAEQ